jgi:hypothetical protein
MCQPMFGTRRSCQSKVDMASSASSVAARKTRGGYQRSASKQSVKLSR